MTLAEYRAHKHLTIQQLADMLGMSGAWRVRTVHRYLTHERIPSRAMMRQIERATGDAVRSIDFPDAPVRRAA